MVGDRRRLTALFFAIVCALDQLMGLTAGGERVGIDERVLFVTVKEGGLLYSLGDEGLACVVLAGEAKMSVRCEVLVCCVGVVRAGDCVGEGDLQHGPSLAL